MFYIVYRFYDWFLNEVMCLFCHGSYPSSLVSHTSRSCWGLASGELFRGGRACGRYEWKVWSKSVFLALFSTCFCFYKQTKLNCTWFGICAAILLNDRKPRRHTLKYTQGFHLKNIGYICFRTHLLYSIAETCHTAMICLDLLLWRFQCLQFPKERPQPSSVVPKFTKVRFLHSCWALNMILIYCMILDLHVWHPIGFPYQSFPISQFPSPGICVGDLAAHLDFWGHSGPGLVGTPNSHDPL